MTNRPQNSFLRSLSDESFTKLEKHLTPVNLALGASLEHAGQRLDWVYFPETSLLSMIASSSTGETVETSMAGNEGAAGLLEACGSQISGADCIIQVDGRAWRTPASVCRNLAASDIDFAARAWLLAELQGLESRQSALCQTLHPVEQRFARWLLESVERCGGRAPLPMTQEFLAAMLGVQRSTVSMFASEIQRRGIIRYRRGRIDILDGTELETLSCECRRATRGHRSRLGFPALPVSSLP